MIRPLLLLASLLASRPPVHGFYNNLRSHLKILGARRVIRSTFGTGNTRILGASVQNLVSTATWRLGLNNHFLIFRIPY